MKPEIFPGSLSFRTLTGRYRLIGLRLISAAVILLTVDTVRAQAFNPGDWQFESQRPALAPAHSVDDRTLYESKPTLAVEGGGKAYADGHWFKEVAVQPGEYFKFHAYFMTDRVKQPGRSILARIFWLSKSGDVIGTPEYPPVLRDKTADGWNILDQLCQAPAGAVKAKLELHYRWDANGIVHFGDVSFSKSSSDKPRIVRLSTIKFRPFGSKTTMENLEKFSVYIAKAASEKADIVCLPEEMTLVGTGMNYVSASEPIPGPGTEYLGNLARKYNLYIVAGLLERVGDVVYNTSVLMDRKGNLAGKYRKISLPNEEIDGGVSPGDSLPVFDTDFGRIGMMICWDVTFPETARVLAQKGAEVIFLPIWGGNITLARARAIENQVYLVSSSYDMATAIFDKEGSLIKEATKTSPVVTVSVDLNQQKLWPGLGDFKNRIPTEMPPLGAIGRE